MSARSNCITWSVCVFPIYLSATNIDRKIKLPSLVSSHNSNKWLETEADPQSSSWTNCGSPRKSYLWKGLFYICILSNFVSARAAWKFSWTSLNITVIRYLYKGPNFKKQSTWLKIGFARALLIFRSGGEHHLVTMVAIPPTNLYNIGQLFGAFFNNLWRALLLFFWAGYHFTFVLKALNQFL